MAAALSFIDAAAIGMGITAAAAFAGVWIDATHVVSLGAATKERTGTTRTADFVCCAAITLRRGLTAVGEIPTSNSRSRPLESSNEGSWPGSRTG